VDSKLSLFVITLAVLNVLVVVEFVRRRKLAENFALLWIAVGVFGIVLSAGRHAVDSLAKELGVYYGTSLVFALGILFLLFVCMNLSMHVSRLTEKAEILAEEVAILRAKVSPEEAIGAIAPGEHSAIGAIAPGEHSAIAPVENVPGVNPRTAVDE
jgi:hypothetical protein